MRRLLYVTPPLHTPGQGGREMLGNVHWDCLQELLGDGAKMHLLSPARTKVFGAMRGEVDGATRTAGQALIERIEREGVDRIFLNGSNLGQLAKMVKRAHPRIEVMTFFHNVETRFFLGALRQHPDPRAIAVLAANHVAERKAARFSDRLIVLNARDVADVRRLHGREATDTLPMALADTRASADTARPIDTDFLLFVGGGFYANEAGVRWFVRTVMPGIDQTLCIVGRGLEPLRAGFAHDLKIRVVGAVDDLDPWYRHATAIVAPIFSGSGMKTKVAEALMHGKAIVGTREAFEGYEESSNLPGTLCANRDDFVGALRSIAAAPPLPFDPALRATYDRYHSTDAARKRLASILDVETPGARS